jgi:hypothetical protein
MGMMKERYMEVVEYAEDCCGFASSEQEAFLLFESIYPGNDEIFWEAWNNWLSFSEYLLQEQ